MVGIVHFSPQLAPKHDSCFILANNTYVLSYENKLFIVVLLKSSRQIIDNNDSTMDHVNNKLGQIKQEIEELVKDLNYHSYRYHVLDSPVISDEEYDRRYLHLKALEEKSHYVLPDSPTQRVGAPPLEKFVKVKHTVPLLSLDNAFSYDEVREFDKRVKKLLG